MSESVFEEHRRLLRELRYKVTDLEEMNRQLREQNTSVDAECARLEAENTALREALAAPVVSPGYALVPLEFVQKFNTLAHNYSLRAEAPDFYYGRERDVFARAYAQCGEALAEVRAVLAAAPKPKEQTT